MKSRFELPLSLIVFQYYWLGLSDLGEAGSWTWQHSWSQPAYTHWAEGEPDGGGQAGDIVTRAGYGEGPSSVGVPISQNLLWVNPPRLAEVS